MIAKIAAELLDLKEKKLLRKLGIPEAFAAAVKTAIEELSQDHDLHSSAAGQPTVLMAKPASEVSHCPFQRKHCETGCKPSRMHRDWVHAAMVCCAHPCPTVSMCCKENGLS